MLRNNHQSKYFHPRRKRFSNGNPPKRKELNIHHFIQKVKTDASSGLEQTEHKAKNSFGDFSLDQRLMKNVTDKRYFTPTPIQDQAIPPALEGRDVIGLANTGTGKTAAFLLPLINKILLNRSQKVLILAPTRELAGQINDELYGFSKGLNIFSVLCIGGSDMRNQRQKLKQPFNFLIGTPGRLIDLMKRGFLNLNNFQNMVLDEADRMVDMGFIRDIKLVFSKLPKQRQTMFFTATMAKQEEDLCKEFLVNPVMISVKRRDTAANVEQHIVHVKGQNEKMEVLLNLLRAPDFHKVLVFGRTKYGVEKISKQLSQYGFRVDSIHGNKTQNYRLRALRNFKTGLVRILVATDVAARGLDIDRISHVVNYDLPATYDDYIHRIGRTGRAAQKGKAISLVVK